ncbi:hypothetical protein [Rhizobium ruizarguesonis]|jgi:hypothetical protein|nr:hypothetical protein [Rhizobium ruizarguesonis]NEI08323.1 hypothetical protein [Rhizobium ruizarguesonis]NEI30297.1 hypothetical protein [Rhizobium ruizarguesonis]
MPIPIVLQLVEKRVIGETPAIGPGALQVRGLIASIVALQEVLDLMTRH